MNYYSTLGISAGATADEVRQAYLALAKKYHPDKNKSPGATTIMAEINLAYETLCDSQRRKQYDLENGIVADAPVYIEEEEEIGQEPSPVGRCVRCNFVNSSGMFVCSVCGYTFDPGVKRKKADIEDDESDEEQDVEDNLSEIIRCPQCNEINMYSRGSCWQCGLQFEVGEVA